jgi:hypothetical protein
VTHGHRANLRRARVVAHGLSSDTAWYQACFTKDVTSKTPPLELMPPDQKDDAAPALHPLGDIALPTESAGPGNAGRNQPSHAERRGAKSNAHYGTALVATCAGIVWCVLLVYVYFGRSAPQEPTVSATVAPVNRSNPSERAENAGRANNSSSDIGVQRRSGAE